MQVTVAGQQSGTKYSPKHKGEESVVIEIKRPLMPLTICVWRLWIGL